VCVLNGTKLEPNKTYKLGNNKFNPKGAILQHLNTNKLGIKFTDVTYDSSAAVVTGLINREIEVGYTATGNVGSAIKSGSIECLYTTGATKYGQKLLSEFTEKSQLNDYKLGMMVFVKNLSAEQIDRLQKSLQKDFATAMNQQDMVGSKIAPNKTDIDQFIATAKLYGTYN
jgi:tripartite-type tricarboxylate transporter receptor subunit TctC